VEGLSDRRLVVWLRFFGARRIVMTEPVSYRRELALQLGATDAFDPSVVEDAVAGLAAYLGCSPDVVIEVVARPGILNQAISLVRKCGRIVSGGVSMSPDRIDNVAACFKDASIRFPGTYTKAEWEFIAEMIGAPSHRP
jgi:threonine dehydrogenase-like Zn-dependent dehydrogenase